MEAQVFSTDGSEKGTVTLSDAVFAGEVSEGSIYYAIQNELANARIGTAKTKSRSEVRGSHRKPWRQKGTGRARAGTFQSPVRVGGGVAFGPTPRSYRYAMPRKAKRLALRSIFSERMNASAVKIVEDFTVESGKTKDMVAILRGIVEPDRVVFVFHQNDEQTRRASRNIPWLRTLSCNRLNAHDLYYSKTILLTESAAQALGDILKTKKAAAEVTHAE